MIALVVTLINPFSTRASSIFFPDSDTALLVNMVFNTAEQINRLEMLLSKTEKLTGKFREYNEIVQDHYFQTQYLLSWVEDTASLVKSNPNDLKDLNDQIENLKNKMDDIKGYINELEITNIQQDKVVNNANLQISRNKDLKQGAKKQALRISSAKTVKEMTKYTAQNTAVIANKQIEQHNTQLEILKAVSDWNRMNIKRWQYQSLAEKKRKEFFGMKKSTNVEKDK